MTGFDLAPWLNTVHQGDCARVMRRIPAESVDLVFTSPPYNLRTSSGNGRRNWPGYDGHSDDMPHRDYVRWQRRCLTQMMRVLAPHGAIFYNHVYRVQHGRLQGHNDILAGFPVRQIIIWNRSGGTNHNPGYYLPTYEVIYLIAKPGFRLAQSYPDIWRAHQEDSAWIPEIPTFPLELPLTAIKTTGARVVLDPFLGSGTTAAAAKLEGRDYIGIEKSRRYCQIVRRRLELTRPGESLPLPPEYSVPSGPDPVQVNGNARLVYDRIRAAILTSGQQETVLRLQDVADGLGLGLRTVQRATAQLKAAGHIAVANHGRWAIYSLPPSWVGGTPAVTGQQTPLNGGTSPEGFIDLPPLPASTEPPDKGGTSLPDLADLAVHADSAPKTRPSLAVHR